LNIWEEIYSLCRIINYKRGQLTKINVLEEEERMEVLKVSAKSNPNSVAGALAGVIRENGNAEIQAIGAGAINQAVKAVAIARGFVAPSGVDLICIPAFTDISIEGEERTAIKFIIQPR
jgi:stage V sporulation protein S